jgi:hypothetical protein
MREVVAHVTVHNKRIIRRTLALAHWTTSVSGGTAGSLMEVVGVVHGTPPNPKRGLGKILEIIFIDPKHFWTFPSLLKFSLDNTKYCGNVFNIAHI